MSKFHSRINVGAQPSLVQHMVVPKAPAGSRANSEPIVYCATALAMQTDVVQPSLSIHDNMLLAGFRRDMAMCNEGACLCLCNCHAGIYCNAPTSTLGHSRKPNIAHKRSHANECSHDLRKQGKHSRR
jgi:hypothetical protein